MAAGEQRIEAVLRRCCGTMHLAQDKLLVIEIAGIPTHNCDITSMLCAAPGEVL